MAWGKKADAMSDHKKELLNEAKNLGLNVEASMSEYELEHRIDEEKEKNKKPAAKQPSSKHGEY